MTNRIPWGPDSPGYPNCPVPAGHDCTVWLRGGLSTRDNKPEEWVWHHFGGSSDIIAYCDHDAPDQARELLKRLHSALQQVTGDIGSENYDDLLDEAAAYLKGAS